jgi:hypothetical protein
MKKILSLLLICGLLLPAIGMLSGCGFIFGKSIDRGSEAAKLLLANERLNGNLLTEGINFKVNVGGDSDEATAMLSEFVQYEGDGYTWDSFKKYSMSAYDFMSFTSNIENEAERAAKDIANMKNNVGIIDKWVPVGLEQHMLRVYESRDVLLVKGEYGDAHVYIRYTDENAKNVYEMYSFNHYEDGTTGEIKTLYIPNERCEYAYENSGGFSDYFIADNSRGYWMTCRYAFTNDEISFYPNVLNNEGLSFETFASYNKDGAYTHGSCTVYDPIGGTDVMKIWAGDDSVTASIFTGAIKDGLISITSDDVYYETEDDVYLGHSIDSITTDKGTFEIGEAITPGGLSFTDGTVDYNYYFEGYNGRITFSLPCTNAADGLRALVNELKNELGITIAYDIEDAIYLQAYSDDLGEEYGSVFEWNGYDATSRENVMAALEVLHEDFADAKALYDEVKDYEVVSESQRLSPFAHFAGISIDTQGENHYSGGIITLSGINVVTSDTALMESGMDYVLKVGLSRVEGGALSSVNTVALSGGTGSAVTFEENAIALSESGSFTVPKNLLQGEYSVVVYIAEAESGIRVSEMKAIAFLDAEEGTLESTAMDITVTPDGESLKFTYLIKNNITIEIEATREVYTYEEVRHLIMAQILAKGAPFEGAELEYADGGEIADEAELTAGSYRMMCYLNTSDGLAQSYVYLNIK